MAIKIFVSHAAADETLASALVDCIFSCMVLEDEDVRCTSVPGHKLPIGGDSSTILRDELGETGVVIGLLTQNSIVSSWVLFELGATWGARKNLQPLLTDEVDYSDIPGPLAGCHVGKLAKKSDLVQFFEELRKVVGAKARSSAKVDSAISQLVKANSEYSKVLLTPKPPKKVKAKSDMLDPTISGMKFSELKKVLEQEKIVIPPPHSGAEEETESDLLTIFLGNYTTLCDGLQSNWDSGSAGGFLYREVGLKLIPYDLVKFDKLPATQAKFFKRLIISPNGQKFVAHFKRLRASE
ncbi:toll/interleukin-1 receptor domain-containing protein [Pseudidiomarina sp. 1APP75-32.1]|uniref:Toll/interleukin-1 receptor domain-containing protein n=1 Tax=Pseudidiomarina terrestris TaxID=2820060 RepID=A0AAW7QTH1_9GAMM|nr:MULTISPECIES: toll/interleukin-1 receptor domain-containing protein [unclassified Pseudidiomarina]MDN7123457.1 toll/interleukin-1 receptor domain-containing protein [Pseudidiomarina sp. 1APP75-32.1]MDN7128818.1 toll/interleukin-1 receptor domain-containing protein [Pseudidiomarina sp. 1APR75-15]